MGLRIFFLYYVSTAEKWNFPALVKVSYMEFNDTVQRIRR
jgi:hypothetical protein